MDVLSPTRKQKRRGKGEWRGGDWRKQGKAVGTNTDKDTAQSICPRINYSRSPLAVAAIKK